MPISLSGTVTWEDSITCPVGTDTRTIASVQTPLQELANRTSFLLDRTDGSGVRRIRRIGTIEEAQNISTFSVGDVIIIGQCGAYYGMYVFDTYTDIYAETNFPWTIQATGGYLHWFCGSLHLLDYSSGGGSGYGNADTRVVQTDNTGKIAQPACVPDRILCRKAVAYGRGVFDWISVAPVLPQCLKYNTYTAGGTYAVFDMTNSDGGEPMAIRLPPLKEGDVIKVRASGGAWSVDNIEHLGVRLILKDDRSHGIEWPDLHADCAISLVPLNYHRWSVRGQTTVDNTLAGDMETVSVVAQLCMEAPHIVSLVRGLSMLVTVVRP